MSFRTLSLIPVLTALAGAVPASALEVVGPEAVLRHWTVDRGGTLYLEIDGYEYELITDPASPLVSSLGDGSFHPMRRDEVEAAVASLGSLTVPLDLRILILPYPRRHVLKSSCQAQTIVLSPGILEVPRAHVWATVVHEIGHALQHRQLPEAGERWAEYLQLRELEEPRYHDHAIHRDRPREIFAEDFRWLYGSGPAVSSGTIENPDLPLPDLVPGLVEWFERVVRSPRSVPVEAGPDDPRVSPNPFRASGGGVLHIRFARGPEPLSAVPAVVHDVSGRRVRVLTRRHDEPGLAVFAWDGRTDHGSLAGSGIYFVRWDGAPGRSARVQILR